MKRFLGAAFILTSLLAFSQPSWADPAPSQIQAEIDAGQWQQAHNDLITVLRDHPESHKAQGMLATVDSHLAQQGNGGTMVPLNVAPTQSHHSGLLPIVLLVVGIWLVFRIIRARQRRNMGYGAPGQGYGGGGPNPFNPNMPPPGYNNPNMYPQQPPAAGGGLMGGLAGGFLGGAIAEELLGNRDRPVNETIINENGNNNSGNDGWDNNNDNSQQADNWNNDDNSGGGDSWT